ncbi:HAD-like domain-containing protein [Armillaria novae-zelandiae]|uniref:HAD-like domain-containing protein n=1 Tax=Armillaria novae-zelandiae TaxID=153914 RepID=A0AA39PUI1_9AGAR|nr:HAD-like domain-containing protein [Armillaria novae-zelandiae]
MPSTTFHVDAALFDMDGTLVDSTAGVEGAWEVFRQTYPSIDIHEVLSSAHGVRTVENLRVHCGVTDPEELEIEAERFETAIVTSASANGKQGIVLLPGVARNFAEINPGHKLPNPSWAICTSATKKYATAALGIAGVTLPDVLVVAEDVEKGKPAPDPYLLGAKKCGVKPENCVVFEDAPAGIRSGKAAGCKTIGFLTTHSRELMEAVQPDFLVPNMDSITIRRVDSGLDITVTTE